MLFCRTRGHLLMLEWGPLVERGREFSFWVRLVSCSWCSCGSLLGMPKHCYNSPAGYSKYHQRVASKTLEPVLQQL